MTVKRRRRLINFESCSVALFASIVLTGAALPHRGQLTGPARTTPSSSTRSVATVLQPLPLLAPGRKT